MNSASMFFAFARTCRMLGVAALLLSACAQPAAKPMTVERAAGDAIADLDASADTHAKTLAVSRWMQRRLKRAALEPQQPVERVLSAGRMDAMGAAGLFRAMLASLGIQTRVMLAAGRNGVTWYPLVEVRDTDGDHAWDPYYGRYAADADGTPLPISGWRTAEAILSTAGDLTAPAIQEPRLQVLAKTAGAPLSDGTAFISHINLTHDTQFGTADASDAELAGAGEIGGAPGLALAAVGERTFSFASGSFALRFAFPNAETDVTVTLQYGLVAGSPRDLFVVASGAALMTRDDDHHRLTFALEATTASITLGARAGRRVGFDYLWWSGL